MIRSLLAGLIASLPLAVLAADGPAPVDKPGPRKSAFYDFWNLSAEFTAPSGERHTVAGFWDGSDTWRVRFSPPEIGTWSYVTRSQPADGVQRRGNRTFLPAGQR